MSLSSSEFWELVDKTDPRPAIRQKIRRADKPLLIIKTFKRRDPFSVFWCLFSGGVYKGVFIFGGGSGKLITALMSWP